MTGQIIYSSSDVSKNLGIQESTIRKYALLLEEHGYKWYKNEHGTRGFFDKDLIVLRKLIELKSGPDMTLKSACIALMAWLNTGDMTNDVTEETTDINVITPERAHLEEVKAMLNVIYTKQLEQQEHVSQLLKKNDETLCTSLKSSMENKRLLNEILEMQKQMAATQKNKSWIQRLFRRG